MGLWPCPLACFVPCSWFALAKLGGIQMLQVGALELALFSALVLLAFLSPLAAALHIQPVLRECSRLGKGARKSWCVFEHRESSQLGFQQLSFHLLLVSAKPLPKQESVSTQSALVLFGSSAQPVCSYGGAQELLELGSFPWEWCCFVPVGSGVRAALAPQHCP